MRARLGTGAVDRLLDQLFAGVTERDLVEELGRWLAASSRYRAFVDAHRDKVRKKLRGALDADAARDVRTELRVAQLLLADRRIDLAFEPYGATRGGPDFTVTVRGEGTCNLEVTRPRRPGELLTDGGPLLPKLRQLPPSVPNVLVIAIDGGDAAAYDAATITSSLRQRADARDEAFFTRRGFLGTRDFHRRYARLGAVIALADAGVGDARATLWTNSSARIAVPARAARLVLGAFRAGDA